MFLLESQLDPGVLTLRSTPAQPTGEALNSHAGLPGENQNPHQPIQSHKSGQFRAGSLGSAFHGTTHAVCIGDDPERFERARVVSLLY